MTAHKHAALMSEYAKDAAEIDKPWLRWEFYSEKESRWVGFEDGHPTWYLDCEYRRKRTPLCQVEGRDVFAGDRLWQRTHGFWLLVEGRGDTPGVLMTNYGPWGAGLLSWSETRLYPSSHIKFKHGDTVKKIKGSQWHGTVVGWYATELTPEGYAVESHTERGSVQIYPAAALERWTPNDQIQGRP